MSKLKVYLSGGMRSNWQNRVIDSSHNNFTFFNPANHNLKNSKEYTNWDVFYTKRCDIIFAYMEKDNPSGIGLSFELGIANALGKLIILVDEKSCNDSKFEIYFKIVKDSSNIIFDKLQDGIEFLNKFSEVENISNFNHF